MSKVLSLKIKEDVFEEVERLTRKLHVPRNAYINEALELYNQLNEKKGLKRQLLRESLLTRKSSAAVLEEMEQLEDDLA